MISEGSCDTEDLSNDAENSLELQKITVLVSIRDFFRKHFKIYLTPNFWMSATQAWMGCLCREINRKLPLHKTYFSGNIVHEGLICKH